MIRALWPTLILSLTLTACSSSKDDNGTTSTRNDFASKPLTPGDLQSFESLIQAVGRFEHSYLGTTTADETLLRLQAAVRGACTATGSYERPLDSAQLGADGKPRRQAFTLNGPVCPVYANLSLSQSKPTPTLWMGGGDWIIANADLAQENGLKKISVRVQRSDVRKSTASTRISSLQDTWVYDKDGVQRYTIRATSELTVTATGVTGTRSIEVFAANGDRLVEMNTVGQGPTADYFLNSSRIPAATYEAYLSALGPLVSGTGNEAG